jgi:hypothetical protein
LVAVGLSGDVRQRTRPALSTVSSGLLASTAMATGSDHRTVVLSQPQLTTLPQTSGKTLDHRRISGQ